MLSVCLFFHTRDLDSLSGVDDHDSGNHTGRRDGGRRRREGGGCCKKGENSHLTDQFDRLSGEYFGPDVVSTAGDSTDPDPEEYSDQHVHSQEEEDQSGLNFRNADDDVLPTFAVFTES